MSFHEQVHVIGHDLQCHYPPAVLAGLPADQRLTLAREPTSQDRAAALWAPHHVISLIMDPTCGNLHLPGHARHYTHRLCQARRPKTAVPSRGA
jgi:hypothetical protein